jgi:pilus assembly protein CpaB
MKPKTLILMLVAVACGLVAAFLASQYSAKDNAASNQKHIWVAKVDLGNGTKLAQPELQLELKPFPPDSVPQGAYEAAALNEQIRNKVLGRSLPKNSIITSDCFTLAEDLFKDLKEPGYVAITIPVDVQKSVAGFCLPGSRINLMLTFTDPKTRAQKTQTFMENVRILAVNTEKNQPKEGPGVMPTASTFTLAVKPEEAHRIMLAGSKGAISVALRRPGEDAPMKPKAVDDVFAAGEGGPDGREAATVKVWVARNTLLPGRDVTEADFEAIPYTQSLAEAQNALTEREKVGGTLKHLVAAGHPITRGHFQAVPSDKTSKHIEVSFLRIEEGSKEPKWVKFENGVKAGNQEKGSKDNETSPTPPAKPNGAKTGSEGATEK